MFYTQEMTKFETTFVQRGQVFEANVMMDLEDEHKRQSILRVDVGSKKITFTRSVDDVEKMKLVLDVEGDMMSNVVKFTGKLQETRWWKEGTPVEFIFKNKGDNIVFYTVLIGKQMTRASIKADVTLETKDTE